MRGIPNKIDTSRFPGLTRVYPDNNRLRNPLVPYVLKYALARQQDTQKRTSKIVRAIHRINEIFLLRGKIEIFPNNFE